MEVSMNISAEDALKTSLCDSKGQLNPHAIGFSSRPSVHCAIPGHFGRRKRWNHWCITSPQWMLSITQADFDYIGLAAANFVDLISGKHMGFSQTRLFARDCHLPDRPFESHSFEHPLLQLRVNDTPYNSTITLSAANHGGDVLQAILHVQRPAHMDSANLVAPLGPNSFHATSRQLGLPCTGTLQLNSRIYESTAAQSFASLDFGRGVWPLNSHWKRAAFAAPGGIAGNFGSGWTDHSGLSENTLWFGGQALHLESPVNIEAESTNSMAVRQLRSADGKVQLSFSPCQKHQSRRNFGLLYISNFQLFGHFNGMLRGEHNECVPVQNALGWLGETETRW
uniref:DUF2804 domain-containing protein n=2 Tax=Pseudomonas sp. TTU2014-080ASC TaxID=1729724 RepID=UPI000A5BAFA2|nr:DUF2804 domain-containing protein [Pseudomonas sp. TTU2014-080ASC]